jgi:RNA-directed DNA polymerase
LKNQNNEETQMTIGNTVGASSAEHLNTWDSIPWSKVKAHVFRLQTRIAKAEREGRRGKV